MKQLQKENLQNVKGVFNNDFIQVLRFKTNLRVFNIKIPVALRVNNNGSVTTIYKYDILTICKKLNINMEEYEFSNNNNVMPYTKDICVIENNKSVSDWHNDFTDRQAVRIWIDDYINSLYKAYPIG